jgi:predicted anti-sigma-YlaC factor YlaD
VIACDDARLAVSLALDGELHDVGLRQVRRHLASCADCRDVVAGMEDASVLLRHLPLERFRCELHRGRLARQASAGHGRQWAAAAVAVLALVLATGSLPQPHGTPAARPVVAVAPLALPIGQRSALDDFAARPTATRRTS